MSARARSSARERIASLAVEGLDLPTFWHESADALRRAVPHYMSPTMAGVARSRRGMSTLHEATGGDPSRSPRWHMNMQMGGDQKLLVALRTGAGHA